MRTSTYLTLILVVLPPTVRFMCVCCCLQVLSCNLFDDKPCVLQDRETVVLPRRPDASSTSRMVLMSIVKVLEFSSQTLRSGVVVLADDRPQGSALLFLRGAPAVIRGLVDAATVPADFDQACVFQCQA